MSGLRSVRSTYPSRLLIVECGAGSNSDLIAGTVMGIDQLFSILTTYITQQKIPHFSLIVASQQSETLLPLISIRNNHLRIQCALYKLQILGAQKLSTSIKQSDFINLNYGLELATEEINSFLKNEQDSQIFVVTMNIVNFARELPWIKSLSLPNDDEHIDRLNHRHTVGIILVCCAIVVGIALIHHIQTTIVGYQTRITYTLIIQYRINCSYMHPDDHIIIGYYQWTPLILLFMAFCFYLPRMLWRSMNTRSGIDIQNFISQCHPDKRRDAKTVTTLVNILEQYCSPLIEIKKSNIFIRCLRVVSCTSGKRMGNYLSSLNLFVKFLYVLNSLVQILLLNLFLGQDSWLFGIDVWNTIISGNILKDSPYFPRVTLCDLRVREIGIIHRYTVQCVLPINILNEKIFMVLWFWFIYIFIRNVLSFISTLCEIFFEGRRISYIRRLYTVFPSRSGNDRYIAQFTSDYLMYDGTLIIHLISDNADDIIAAQVVIEMLNKYAIQQENGRIKYPQENERIRQQQENERVGQQQENTRIRQQRLSDDELLHSSV
ncbi:unnamed protein product [Didymodactylos carnosus]|uniref:Innexin n=1 Tax=Didymodactylos carnosus TaxID=1234261 RepID=A0A813TWY8_9BILA|nr:unnamed protein product [Didymodactylos carnosus]CAF0817558.1 unnamed protein product [Didymodactylos carnosus]CAF3500308.1 unnamed protein product [Didymodactylos carnosus]CAF3603800.1 unnamed protein product [Didymodactylos carnosus]